MNRIISLLPTHDELFAGERGVRIPYHRMYGKEYCLSSLVHYRRNEYRTLQVASEQADRIYRKALRFVQRYLPDTLLINQLGIHPRLIPAARMEVPYHGVSRQDWIVNNGTFKLIENNTDTPTGIPEAAYLADSMIKQVPAFQNPSEPMDISIRQAFSSLLAYYREQGFTGEIVFSCYEWHEEDFCNTMYLMEQVCQAGFPARFVSLEKLEVQPGVGLFADGEKVDIWYRLYPLEYLVYDRDGEGFATGEEILDLVRKQKLAIINPAQSIITQSKGLMAIIWSLFEKRKVLPKVFDEEEYAVIERYFLPTYFDENVFHEKSLPYVSKALFGREGKGTLLYNQAGEPESSDGDEKTLDSVVCDAYYNDQIRIYQRREQLEQINVRTEEGEFCGYLLTGVFVMGGQYAGLLPRIGNKVTGNLAYFAPAAL
ncbi:glutathionylspermidine synthase family protein [Ammoniphilus sp. 3BR4]|uniref:glutathionylspermidine synthase family protein n=1 Tax=Ammoniphilus sp. 3BR4 TaxID=3158265 RepID=UPI003465BDA7